ncbi:MAG: ribokinase [Oscillospiraceae bacterium]
MRVLNFGSLNIDKVYTVESFVKPGETISSLNYQVSCGGKGLNQSIAMKRAGVENLYHAGKIAKDGRMLLEALEENSIDTQFVMKDGDYTGEAIIQVDSSGQNSIILYSGANGDISNGEACAVLSHFKQGDKILLQNEISGLEYIIKKAHEKGMEIFLNPSPITQELLRMPLELVDCFLMNEIETAEISGESNPDKALEVLKKKFPKAKFVVTLGKYGVKYYDGKEVYYNSAYNVKSVDSTAAGDTFTGYFMAGYIAGEAPEKIIETASKAAAISVTRKGAAESIPTVDDISQIILEPSHNKMK